MARNRKYESAGIRWIPALKAVVLCLLIGGSGVGYVWQKTQIHELGRQIKQRELALEESARRNKQRRDQLDELRSPPRLDARVKLWHPGLGLPQQSQIVRLPEPTASDSIATGRTREQLYVEQRQKKPSSP
jgi:hypothetical protein